MAITWVMVANSAVARIFELDGNSGFKEVETLIHPASRLHGRDLTSDRPGRAFESSNPSRHSIEPATLPKEVEFEVFARDISQFLHKALEDRRFSRLQIAAGPHFLGLLRLTLTPNVLGTIYREISKDLTQLTTAEIKEMMGH